MSFYPLSRHTTWYLLTCGFAAPLFVAVILVQDALRPGYASLHRFPSELSLGELGWVQTANFILAGLLLVAFALGLRRALGTGRGSRMAPVLAATCGVALLVAGAFPMDPTPGYPPGSATPDVPTLHGTIHGFAPFTLYVALTTLTFVLARRFAAEPGRRRWMWYSVATGIAAPATFMIAAARFDFQTQTGQYHGLWHRVGLVIGLGWLGVLALRLMLDHAHSRPANQEPAAEPTTPEAADSLPADPAS